MTFWHNCAGLTQARAVIERRLNRRYVQSVCLIVLAVYLAVLSVSFTTHVSGRTRFGPYLGADFAAFYVAGSIFNSYAPERVYDRELHTQLYRQLFPGVPKDTQLPYANAPFFVLPFPLLARLPYPAAYLAWLLISVGLYAAGLNLLRGTLDAMPKDAWPTAMLLALSFAPFLIECLAGGQTSAFGFFLLAVVLLLERRGHSLLSGAALAFCTYKPTLLLLILPMLVITRSLRTLLGFAVGCSGLAAVSLLAVGWQGCLSYMDTLMYFTTAATSAVSGLRTWKYVDISSFFRLLAGGHTYVRWVMTLAAVGLVLPPLVTAWLSARCGGATVRSLAWAATIALTPVLNIYVGIYDTVLIVLSALLTTDALYRRAEDDRAWLTPSYKYWLLLLYLTPLVTQTIARLTGVQLYTLVLAGFGLYLLEQFRSSREETAFPSAIG